MTHRNRPYGPDPTLREPGFANFALLLHLDVPRVEANHLFARWGCHRTGSRLAANLQRDAALGDDLDPGLVLGQAVFLVGHVADPLGVGEHGEVARPREDDADEREVADAVLLGDPAVVLAPLLALVGRRHRARRRRPRFDEVRAEGVAVDVARRVGREVFLVERLAVLLGHL